MDMEEEVREIKPVVFYKPNSVPDFIDKDFRPGTAVEAEITPEEVVPVVVENADSTLPEKEKPVTPHSFPLAKRTPKSSPDQNQ